MIAVVGIGGLFPDAPDPERYWDNVAAGRCAAREVPAGRWLLPPERAFDPERGAPDKVYSTKGCFVEGFAFDPAGLELAPGLAAELDPVFQFALHAGRQAFLDAKTGGLDRGRVGVILGNLALPTDAFSDYSRRVLGEALGRHVPGAPPSPSRRVHPFNRYPAGLPAGLLARALGLGGGAFTLDAACASSLYALQLACEALSSGRADAMLAGGVSRPECLYTQMGFSQLRALSPSGRPAPLDAAGDGLVVGEGAGVFVLKRLSDALSQGDRIYGVIRGIGLSNDIGGSLLAPDGGGQLRAMRAAYAQAGWRPEQLDLIECHATGTPVGDAVELASLRSLWGPSGWTAGQCALGSAKSNVGHTLTAAGAAGLMKVLLALRAKTLPPSANFREAPSGFGLDGSPFRVVARGEPWQPAAEGAPRRAAVSAFGFGGINAHVLVEEWREASRAPSPVREAAPQALDVAIVGMEARFGALTGLRAFQEAVLAGTPAESNLEARWAESGFGAEPPAAGRFLRELSVPAQAYRIPPKELEEMLPQQALMLEAAAAALRDVRATEAPDHERTGVFIGMELDCNTANFHFRWSLPEPLRETAGPALSANRTMGALGGIIASRIAREFRIGGPSFTIASDETAGLRALEAGARALRRFELDCAVVGAVDVAGDPRAVRAASELGRLGAREVRPFDPAASGAVPGEGAAAVVLKRLEDAIRDGDRVYAVLKGLGAASGPEGSPAACLSAFERAYADAAADPASVEYVETHGGAVPREDAAEAEALARFFAPAPASGGPAPGAQPSSSGAVRGDGPAPAPASGGPAPEAKARPLALGAVKPVIGHAGAAAGLASLVKAALAVYQQLLPAFPLQAALPALAGGRFHAPHRPQFWLRNRVDGPRRAGVTALGLGGNCVHAVLEEGKHLERPVERLQPLGARAEALFVLEAETPPGLVAASRRLRAWIEERAESPIEALARAWWAETGSQNRKPLAVAFVARDDRELVEQTHAAEKSLVDDPASPIQGLDRIFYSPVPLGRNGRIAFVFPGSGNQYVGMGLGVSAQWPEVLRAQDAENERLRDQMVPHLLAPWLLERPAGWEEQALDRLAQDHKAMIFGQVSHGTVLSDLVRAFGVEPHAVIGYSLGETAGLFALRVWKDRDAMLRRLDASTLFVSDLAGPCDAVRRSWGLAAHEAVDWALGVVDRPEKLVRAAVDKMERVFVLIVNTPKECVVGGARHAVRKMMEELGGTFLPLHGVTTVHCSVAKEVEDAYRELHLLPTGEPGEIQFYSGAWARPYPVTAESAADAVTAQAVGGIDFPAVVNRAYDDGIRLFVELGPRGTCSRMIAKILGERPHAARSACVRDQDDVSTVLRLLGQLCAERVPIDLGKLYGEESPAHRAPEPPKPSVRIPLGRPAPRPVAPARPIPMSPSPAPPAPPLRHPAPVLAAAASPSHAAPAEPVLRGLVVSAQAAAEAHQQFLKLSQTSLQAQLRALELQAELAAKLSHAGSAAPAPPAQPVFMTREQCLEFAVGKIGAVLGARFASVDAHPTRVRLPDEPLMLVDRIVSVSGEPQSMTSGRVVTEHDVLPGAWYLDGGRIPTCIAVEAGQADLFLSGYLGIDAQTRGLAMYRLLDAAVTFHQGLPRPGDTIRYDIRIERFARQGDTWLFFFDFESTVGGRPLLSMRKGCAGFFTAEQLAAGKGIVFSELDRRPNPGKRPPDWKELAPMAVESYDARAVDALREGDLESAFGPAFSGLPLRSPLRLAGRAPSRMRLVDRVERLDPRGGRYGLGSIVAEADIDPGAWFLACHFSDDQVMPGTLMYECCLHTLRIFLTRMGWVGEHDACGYEPLPGVASRLKCRGQVLPSTRTVAYELSIKELGYGPEPYAIADALMYADGHPIVLISDLSVRLRGLDREAVEALWARPRTPAARKPAPLFDAGRILAFAVGKPSEAFGEPYRVFDAERVIARLPGPPYQFLDRIVDIRHARPFELEAGAEIVAEYDVPPDAWYFRRSGMPFAVLLETALQPCGWLAAYLGSALRSETDLSFRNLGGKAVLHAEVLPDAGTLSTRVTLTRVSQSAGMIIQNYDLEVRRGDRLVYQGDTYFGFFSKEALADQKGILGIAPHSPTPEERARGLALAVPEEGGSAPGAQPSSSGAVRGDGPAPAPASRGPAPSLRMLDSIPLFIPDGGPKRLGFVRGLKKVDPAEWFFKAHFFQDPVCPGSLGLESFQQLLQAAARERWGEGLRCGPIALGKPHEWVYRGQVVPRNKVVTVEAVLIEADDRERRLTADGFLSVDGLLIYQMKGFSLSAA
ncbi:MAG: type I polyketide synthase [Elusimicrobia bacterium]|nr:type I polyketide synthase [Elusimicrobiota bacterium]